MQRQAKFLPRMERDAADLLARTLSADGVETRLNTQVVGARWSNGERLLDIENNELRFSIAADAILLSVGRGPNFTGLGLEAAGVDFDEDAGTAIYCFRAAPTARRKLPKSVSTIEAGVGAESPSRALRS